MWSAARIAAFLRDRDGKGLHSMTNFPMVPTSLFAEFSLGTPTANFGDDALIGSRSCQRPRPTWENSNGKPFIMAIPPRKATLGLVKPFGRAKRRELAVLKIPNHLRSLRISRGTRCNRLGRKAIGTPKSRTGLIQAPPRNACQTLKIELLPHDVRFLAEGAWFSGAWR